MRRRSYTPKTRLHTVWHSPARSPAMMLAEIRDHADCGAIVQVLRAGGGAFQVLRNGERYFVRSTSRDPLATVDTVGEAVMAGNAYLDAPPPEDDFDDSPRGAA